MPHAPPGTGTFFSPIAPGPVVKGGKSVEAGGSGLAWLDPCLELLLEVEDAVELCELVRMGDDDILPGICLFPARLG